MALSWRFKPLRFGCRRSRSRPRHFYRIMLINSRFDNVHPVVQSHPLIELEVSLYVFTIKLLRKTSGRRKLETSGNVSCSRFNCPSYFRLLLLRTIYLEIPSPSVHTHPLDPFLLFEIRFITSRISIYNDSSFFDFLSLFMEKSIVLSRS